MSRISSDSSAFHGILAYAEHLFEQCEIYMHPTSKFKKLTLGLHVRTFNKIMTLRNGRASSRNTSANGPHLCFHHCSALISFSFSFQFSFRFSIHFKRFYPHAHSRGHPHTCFVREWCCVSSFDRNISTEIAISSSQTLCFYVDQIDRNCIRCGVGMKTGKSNNDDATHLLLPFCRSNIPRHTRCEASKDTCWGTIIHNHIKFKIQFT